MSFKIHVFLFRWSCDKYPLQITVCNLISPFENICKELGFHAPLKNILRNLRFEPVSLLQYVSLKIIFFCNSVDPMRNIFKSHGLVICDFEGLKLIILKILQFIPCRPLKNILKYSGNLNPPFISLFIFIKTKPSCP